ncbi:YitT family protein [Neobacillus sp. SM06]|uniref:YitT family protein n=1 Tax=Neobacillus sp. SM06 TaxID=3422492 RepID=UPI003D2D07BB
MPQHIRQISVASLFIATGINGFVVPAHLINGGIWGISLLVNYLWGFNLAIVFICLNLPIYFFAIKYDLAYFYKGLIGTFISAIFIKLLLPLTNFFHFPLLPGVIFGGLLIGIGVGLMLRVHASPGGVDLLALLLSKKTSINPGFLLLGIDAAIILFGVVALRDGRLLYSLLIISIVGITVAFLTGIKSIKIC